MSDLTPVLKQEIDSMTVEQLLRKHRFAPSGDPFYQGDSGEYAVQRLATLRSQDQGAYVRASKQIGWQS